MRLVIAEDNVLLREGLQLLLTTVGHEVVAIAGSGPVNVFWSFVLTGWNKSYKGRCSRTYKSEFQETCHVLLHFLSLLIYARTEGDPFIERLTNVIKAVKPYICFHEPPDVSAFRHPTYPSFL